MSYNEAEPSSPERRRLILIGGGLAIFVVAAVATVIIVSNAGNGQQLTPAPAVSEATVTAPPTSSPAPPAEPVGTPTPLPTPTPVPPYEHQVQTGQGLIDIVQLYGYQTIEIFAAIVALNGLASPDDIQVGQTLLIPRQTATPAPTPVPGATQPAPGAAPQADAPGAGATSPAAQGGDPDNRVESPDARFWIHTVREGDSPALIALLYDSNVPCILRNNNFTYSGNEPIIFVGQQINVCIVSTLTPMPSPTGDPFNSTVTPTPTLSPPPLLAPANGATFGRGQEVTLQWVSTHPLSGDQYYQVVVQDVTGNRELRANITANAFVLPDDLRPSVGQSLEFQWQVLIVEGIAPDAPLISGVGEARQFIWGG